MKNDAWLITNVQTILDSQGKREYRSPVSIRINNGLIQEISERLLPKPGESIIDAKGKLVYPGLVNTHHHLFQSLLKGVPAGINTDLFGWLNSVTFPRVSKFQSEHIRIATRLGLAELMLSGTTTTADHHYVYYEGSDLSFGDIVLEEAEKLGVRLVLCRGGQLASDQSKDYPNKKSPPESLERYCQDIERLTKRYHESGPRAKRKIVVAPNSPPFSLAPQMLSDLAELSRDLGLRMHSHLSETRNYIDYCEAVHHCSPVEFVDRHAWLGEDVWFAHMVHLNDQEISRLKETQTSISHCPVSNGRLGSGIARAFEMDQAGINVSIGVDGAASNEAAQMLGELRLAWLLQRAITGQCEQVTLEKVLAWGTINGAKTLGFNQMGLIQPGQVADLALYRPDDMENWGVHDIAYAPLLCGTAVVDTLLCDGRIIVDNGEIPGLDLPALKADCAQAVTELL